MRVRMTKVGRGWCSDQPYEINFSGLEALKNWIFNVDGVYEKYSLDGDYITTFCTRDDFCFAHVHTDNQYVSCFEIHQIETDEGILFSDGTYTARQRHCNPRIKQFFKECDEKLKAPKFNFV